MRIVALDVSLTRTGWASQSGSGVIAPPATMRGTERQRWIVDRICGVVFQGLAMPLVVIEGYSFGSKGRAVFDIAELGGIIRYTLADCPCTVVEVPPSCLKKYATGKGNAPKELVLVEAVKRLGYQGSDHNVSDALWLLEMAVDQYGGESRVPKAHREALLAVTWPTIAASVVAEQPKRARQTVTGLSGSS